MKLSSAAWGATRLGLAALLLATASCAKTRNPLAAVIGDIPPPDEFQVTTHQPLEMPGSTALPEPQPGMPSPRDPDPQRDAMRALLGASGGTVETASAPSPGEQELLTSANAAAASDDIRVQLEEDKVKTASGQPYSPPSVGELLGMQKKEKVNKADMLEPIAESQRLQQEGVRAPANPNAAEDLKTDKDSRPAPVEPYYPTGRPEPALTAPGTGPAY